MRILVTGALGFVGGHAIRDLREHGHTVLPSEAPALAEGAEGVLPCDITCPTDLAQLVTDTRPDACLHLAGMAFVPASWENPSRVFEINIGGTLNLLEAFRQHHPEARLLVVTSSEVYGRSSTPAPLDEDATLTPENPYAVSKLSADLSALLYTRQYGMHVMTARPHNHIGPGQSERFVMTAFATQLAAMADHSTPSTLRVGNLEALRDFTDVRDVARAYRLLLEQGHAGLAYNIASGHMISIRDMLDRLCRVAGVQPQIEIDPERFRPTDQPPALDTSRIREHTGWIPEIPMDQTLQDLFDEAVQRREVQG